MKKFSIKYTPIVLVLLIICLLSFICGAVLSFIRFFNSINGETVNTVKYILLVILNLFLISFTLSVLFYGKYVIKKDYLILHFGLISTKYALKDIVSINLFKKTNKLVIYFNDQKYTVIIISPKKYNEFISSLKSSNSQIIFEENLENNFDNKQ